LEVNQQLELWESLVDKKEVDSRDFLPLFLLGQMRERQMCRTKKRRKKPNGLRRSRRGGTFALILIILLVVGAVLVLPGVVSGEGFDFGDIWEGIAQFIGNFLGGGDTTGYVGVGFTIHFKDGSSVDYGASPTFQVAPMSITVEDKEVSSIDIFVRAKMVVDGVGPWSADVSQQIEMYKKPSSTPAYSSTGHFTESGADWSSGKVKNLAVTNLDWKIIENVIKGKGPATWFFQVNVEVDLEAEIDGVNQEFNALAPSGGFELKYVDDSTNPTMSVTTESKPIA
jgi:hypothetical protein